jgi:uncharacterized membrane protein YphA (DoxX/SURF4 family)
MTTNLGRYVYGGCSIVLGLIGLAWSDFATNWQRVAPAIPFRSTLADITAVLEIAGGVALFWPRSARAGAAILTTIYSVFTLLWVPKIVENPTIYDSFGNFFEEFSLVVAGLVLCATFAPRDSVLAHSQRQISRMYGLSVVSFALAHIVYFSGLPAWIPKWIPPGQMFWAATTTICFILAAIAILSGIFAALAARLLTVMIIGFELLVWVPKVVSAPHDHFQWSGNGICLVMAGAAWVVSDSIAAGAQRKLKQELAVSTA